ncbi:hypothetical protein M5689_007234 [Euphorbia peplus]|nr:hypothetical protein M5689_007234 [Euphorbia peplus]
MQLYLYQILSSLLFSVTLILVNAQSQDNILYKTCSTPFHCGNLKNITYPFWGPDRPEYCGHPGFFVNCLNQTLFIRTGQLDYNILQIDTNSESLTVSRSDYITTICPSLLFNTTFDQNLFSYTSDVQNITLYYGCDIPSQSLPNGSFGCRLNNTFLDVYFLSGNLNSSSLNISLPSCDDIVILPAMKSAQRFLETSPSQSNLIEALNQGFGWKWSANNSLCETCTSSGGFCGHNATTNSFSCYCSDQNHPFFCESEGNGHIRLMIAAVSSVAILLAVIGSCVVCFCCCCCCFSRRGRFWAKSDTFQVEENRRR